MTAIQTPTVLKMGFGLLAPDGSATFGWDHMPTMESQLRYLRQHKETKPDTVYEPILILFLEERLGAESSWTPIGAYPVNWSNLDLEAFDNGNFVSRAMTQAPPRPDQLVKRPIHDLFGTPVGQCTAMLCHNILDGEADIDPAICTSCWDEI